MLHYETNRMCGCCNTPNCSRVYRWYSFAYCLTCLHSIGVNAFGNPCTDKQYVAAWRRINGDDESRPGDGQFYGPTTATL
jgi:hypothetical protein